MKICDAIKSVLFTNRCRYCRKVIDIRNEICPDCESNLQRINGEICLKCGREKDFCGCKGTILYYKSVVAPFYYEGAIHRTIWLLKFRSQSELSRVIAEEMVDCFLKHYKEYKIDLVTFVPSQRSKMKERGYNPAELIARDFGELIGIEVRPLLKKLFETRSQHLLDSTERTGNLAGAFDGINKELFLDKRVLLIDDVKTTGSTLNECAKTLIACGAAEVICLTGALTGGKRMQNQKNSLL